MKASILTKLETLVERYEEDVELLRNVLLAFLAY